MNRFIQKHGTPTTFAILAVLAWVVYRRFSEGGSGLIPFIAVAVIVWGLGTFVFIYSWPSIAYTAARRAILQYGLGGVPIPVNMLYAVPNLASPSAPGSSLLATETSELLYLGGWLDLSRGPRVLHVPNMAGRYYSVQFTDSSTGTDFAYVSTRTTSTQAGDFLITGPAWKGNVPQEMKQISSPDNSVMVFG